MWFFFVLLYVLYLVLGPHWESRILQGKPLKIFETCEQIKQRSMFISYITLLYTAWFFFRPSYVTFINAFILSLISTISYNMRWGAEEFFPSHIFLNLIILGKGFNYLDTQTSLTTLLMLFYPMVYKTIYQI